MRPPLTRLDDRGVSEVVGYVLLIGVVTVGIVSILLLGGSLVDDIKGDIDDQSTDVSLGSANERLSALSGTRVNSTRFELRGKNPTDVRVRSNASSGHIQLSVNGGRCTATLPLSTIEYDREGARGSVGLQAGGQFTRSADGESSAVVEPPSFTADNGTLDITTYDVTGHIDDRTVRFTKNTNLSETRSRTVGERLTHGHPSCNRPDNVTVTVESRYYGAWADHLADETGRPVTTDPANGTARVYLNQSWLPSRANDATNHVVNLSDASMASVTSNGAPTSAPSYTYSTTTDTLQVDKGVGNNYTAVALPLGNGTQSSSIREVDGDTVYRRPIDVVFVIDESGSMAGDKADATKDAARNFVGAINASSDRVAFVGFNDSSTYHRIEGENDFFTNDTAHANATIDTYVADGGTAINTGLDKANTVHDFRARAGAQKVVILLSDGENSDDSDDDRTLDQSERAAENNVTVFTIGFGNPDEELLRDVANDTGGTYRFADNATELNDVFQNILSNITSVSAIVHRPTTAQLSIGGRRIEPALGYSNPDINRINGSYDINDPRYRGGFEFSASASDGNLINVTAVSYDCEPDAYELTDVFVTNETTNQPYRRVRCTDVDNSSRQVVSPDEAQVFLDGANVSELPDDDEAWYQADLVNDTLAPYISDGELELESNEAVIVFEYTADGETSRIVLLYQIGLDESGSVTEIFDVREVHASVGD
ncbi:vWA domain-containing protein [Haloplanus halophilus]|uniref:vWA domain-containing protein n=1 Tax=Haloplanus halophilus TaxID=2949993 RepID=UPI00203E5F6C|nr:vWA domain-containing protein [Haloplanus sp. GDY1]